MRPLAQCFVLALLVMLASSSGRAGEGAAADPFESTHQLIVVTIPNEPYRPAAHAGTTGSRYTGDSYGLAQSAHDKARRIAATYALREVASWPIKELAVHCVVYEIVDNRPVDTVLQALAKDSRVSLAQPLQQFHTLTQQTGPAPYNDPLAGLQTNLVSLGISAAHERSQGAGIRVGLVDTGVDASHPDLRGRIVRTHSFIGSHAAPANAQRHGTAMAGLIAAVANNNIGIVGIAPLAQIEVFEACWQLKPDDDAAACNTFTLAQALAAALESHSPLINLSIAGPPDPLLTALVQSGLRRGIIFVGSTAETAKAFPTNIEGVIGVGASEQEHSGATLSAPASHILTLRPNAQYDFESGTSVAAAEMTGVIALLLAADARLTAPALVNLLRMTAGGTPDSSEPERTLDVSAALAQIEAQHSTGQLASRAGH